ncbi:hypothetical protein H8697_02020 [[Eubacterium] tenue]|nr:hypothetical protein [[Eubacterium] tenue]MBC8630487.1 hypothetical protein [[Eubacterium] tenue]
MEELMILINRKFLKDTELLQLEDNENVLECKYTKPHNAHYNEYEVTIKNNEKIERHLVYLKHR